MDTFILLGFFAPLLFLILLLVRHARRIHRDAIDKTLRTQHLDGLDRSLVQTVLERDQHTCQTCGATTLVGVDFHGGTPGEGAEVTPEDLEARCTRCYLDQWRSFKSATETADE